MSKSPPIITKSE